MTDNDPEFKEILDNLYDGVYLVDRERQILYWNKSAERISGFSAKQVIGHRCMENILNHVTENGIQLCLNGCPLHATIQDGKRRQAEVYLHHADGHRIPVLVRTSPIRDKDGNIIGAVENFSDNASLLSTRRRIGRLEQAAFIDPGTGIGNRRLLELKLSSAFGETRHNRIPHGILFLDIDYFKQVNDIHGHDIGDRVLEMVAKTIQNNVRVEDTVARWGGEEFFVILRGISRKGLLNSAEKLRHLIAESFVDIGTKEIHVTVSIGASMLRANDTLKSLFKRIDRNLFRSKNSGRNRVSGDGTGGK
jgi:diguanylate cyclase (GGDEF)-like protein/PAS domain S-box-containing protein